ncbi:MAG: CNNM domain-containing protein [bacterium]
MSIPVEFVIILACLLAQSFLAGMEIGVLSINRHRLTHLVRSGARGAKIIEGFLHDTARLLGTTMVGVCLMLVVISTLAESLAERSLNRTGQAISAVVVSLLILIFGEYLPKLWFNRRPIERCLPFAGLLRIAERILHPLVWLTTVLTRWASPRLEHPQHNLFMTREHIQSLVQDSAAGGQISAFERLMINRVLDLQLKTAAEVMTPLKQVIHAHDDATLQECYDLATRSGQTRLPVLDADDGACIGILHLVEILAKVDNPAAITAKECMSTPFFIQPSIPADDLLPVMRRNRQPMAVIRNDAGTVLGVVTQENIVRFLLGALPKEL